MAVAPLLRRVLALTVVAVTVLALPADAAARKLFRSPDHRVVCNFSRDASGPPFATCESRETLSRKPEAPEIGCGSGLSQARIEPRGRTVLYETCNPIWIPGTGEPIKTLNVHEKYATKHFKCSALSKKTVRCASKRTGHGFKVSRTTFQRF